MRITFVTDLGATYTVEIDPKMELENVMALLEAEVGVSRHSAARAHVFLFPCDKSGISPAEQSISFDGRELSDTKATMEGLGVPDNAMLLFRRKVNVAGRYLRADLRSRLERCDTHLVFRAAEQDAEMMRLQILGDPNLMRMVRQVLQSTPYIFSRNSTLPTPTCYRLSQSSQTPHQTPSGLLNS